MASARVGRYLYFAWTAARGSGSQAWLSNPHVEFVQMTTSFTFVSQRAIWNPSHVFAWPYLTSAPNLAGVPQLGISLVWGGGTFFANAAAGDLTTSPFVVDATAVSNANCGCGRWGDYLAVRPYYAGPGTPHRAPHECSQFHAAHSAHGHTGHSGQESGRRVCGVDTSQLLRPEGPAHSKAAAPVAQSITIERDVPIARLAVPASAA
jgi:hypothetical protein